MPALVSSSIGGGGCLDARWKVGGGNGAKAILAFWHIGEVSPFSIHVENRGRMREHKIIGLVPPQCMRDFEFVLLPFLVIAVKRMSVPTTLNPFCPTVVPLLQVTHFIMLWWLERGGTLIWEKGKRILATTRASRNLEHIPKQAKCQEFSSSFLFVSFFQLLTLSYHAHVCLVRATQEGLEILTIFLVA